MGGLFGDFRIRKGESIEFVVWGIFGVSKDEKFGKELFMVGRNWLSYWDWGMGM